MRLVKRIGACGLLLLLAGCVGPAVRRGATYYHDGRYDSALAEFNDAVRALGTDADLAMAYNDRGIVRMRIGDPRGAADDYTRAIALTPGDASLWFNRGNAYTTAMIYPNAIADYTQAVELRPTYSEAFFNRGTARLRAGDLVGARSDWRYAIELEPDPFKRQMMERSTGLGRAAAALEPAPVTPAASPPTAVPVTPAPPAPLPPMPVPPPLVPPAATPTPAAPAAGVALDARALAARGISKEIDGDRAGALADLRAAQTLETDPARRAHIEELVRLLERPRP